ncbi:MAG: hypothetical protein AUI15_14690 [Actinobacteria bacterium 13_2_20CM_2_66_6]|nr:MAG: hypothetical protein AUI15_14690 [Actinobacteria bacterium 13_2_20CM_2_66_6]
MIPLQRVRAAAARAAPHVLRTPMVPVEGALLKLECLQPTGSFKVRGFFAAALALPPESLRRGLLTVSAGNAAQACAYAAKKLGVSCRVVMFDTAPETKVAGVKRWGATPIPMPRDQLFGWIADEGWHNEPESFIHPFADEEVMAGHGGIGLELLDDVPDLRRVVIPVGGGGLVTGIASAIQGMRPEVEIIGVQSDGYPLRAAAQSGRPSARLRGEGGRRGCRGPGLCRFGAADAGADDGGDHQRRQHRPGASGESPQLALGRVIAHGPRLIAAISIQTNNATLGIQKINPTT